MKNLFTFCALLAVCTLCAQPRTELGIMLGAANYLGDLEVSDQLPTTDLSQFAAGIHLAKNLSYSLQLRAQLVYAPIEGRDALQEDVRFQARNFSFRNPLLAGELQFLWEPFARRRFPEEGGYHNIVSPYIFAGLGAARSAPDTRYGMPGSDGFPDRIARDQEARKSPFLQLPIGGGLRFDLSQRTSLGIEVATRKAFSDQLDGVSTSGNPEADDWYITGGLTLTYRWSRPDYDRDGFLDSLDQCPQLAGVDYAFGCPDADGDRVPDAQDRCPYQVGKAEAQGCPDRDYDHVPDFIDDCPDYPGHPSGRGCVDTDGDSIIDDEDLCPNCPGGLARSGCPDADGDGVIDSRDRCPNLAGDLDTEGCPYADADRDGIADEVDRCPQAKGSLAMEGCPDTDGDGLADADDRCPTLDGKGSRDGCPAVNTELKRQLARFTEIIQFETGSEQLKPASKETLLELFTLLESYEYYHLKIAGHTDSQGRASSNLKLSRGRAQACYDFLLNQGIAANRLQYEGFGEANPIASNRSSTGRRRNRRVEFELFLP
jgi:OOP family OmpA-OmpF porin